MTHFHVELDITCPSDWTEIKVREYIGRICPTKEEKDSIEVFTRRCGFPIRRRKMAGKIQRRGCVLPLGHDGEHLWKPNRAQLV